MSQIPAIVASENQNVQNPLSKSISRQPKSAQQQVVRIKYYAVLDSSARWTVNGLGGSNFCCVLCDRAHGIEIGTRLSSPCISVNTTTALTPHSALSFWAPLWSCVTLGTLRHSENRIPWYTRYPPPAPVLLQGDFALCFAVNVKFFRIQTEVGHFLWLDSHFCSKSRDYSTSCFFTGVSRISSATEKLLCHLQFWHQLGLHE